MKIIFWQAERKKIIVRKKKKFFEKINFYEQVFGVGRGGADNLKPEW